MTVVDEITKKIKNLILNECINSLYGEPDSASEAHSQTQTHRASAGAEEKKIYNE